MDLDIADAEAFEDAVALVAEALKDLGDTDDLDIRRARAVGVLADPRAALDLLHRSQTPRPQTRWLSDAVPAPRPGHPGRPRRPRHHRTRLRRTPGHLDHRPDQATAHRLARRGHQAHRPALPRPQPPRDHHPGRRPRPHPSDGDALPAQRPCLRLPRLQETIPPLRPRPHRRLRATRRRRTTRPDPPRQPRPTLPRTPPRQDPRPMALPTPPRRRIPLDHPHRPHHRRTTALPCMTL